MMNINEFTSEVKTKLEELLIGVDIDVESIKKTNGTERVGLIVKSDRPVAPIFYVDEGYEYYCEGATVDSVVKSIADKYMTMDFPAPDMSWDNIKDKIALRVVELARNRELVADKPYIYLDAGFVGLADVIVDGNGRTLITDSIVESLPVDEAELFDIARANVGDAVFSTLGAYGMGVNYLISEEKPAGSELYMLTNGSHVYGASMLFCKDIKRRIHALLGDAYYVVPTSLHEVLIIPASNAPARDDLKTMLRTGNKTVCDEADILSDNVLYFDGDILRVV